MSETKKQVDIEQLQQQMEQAEEERRNTFIKEYHELCKKHSFQLVPEMILRPGAAPVASMNPMPIKK